MSPKLLNILLILIPAILYYAVYVPLYEGTPGLVWTPKNSIPVLQSQNAQYATTLSQVDEVEKRIKKINEDYKAVPDDVKTKVTTMLPDNLQAIRIRNEVVSIADKNGIAISSLLVTLDSSNLAKGLGGYTISFSMKGRYSIFKKTMESFESNMRFFTANSLVIKRRGDKESPSTADAATFDKDALNITVSFKVSYLKPSL
jgi:hypothetical protein